MKTIVDLIEGGVYEPLIVERRQSVRAYLKEKGLEGIKSFGVIVNGKRAEMSDLIRKGDDVAIIPFLAGGASHLERIHQQLNSPEGLRITENYIRDTIPMSRQLESLMDEISLGTSISREALFRRSENQETTGFNPMIGRLDNIADELDKRGFKERVCFLCNRELPFKDFLMRNIKKNLSKMIKIWENGNAQIMCCACFSREENWKSKFIAIKSELKGLSDYLKTLFDIDVRDLDITIDGLKQRHESYIDYRLSQKKQ